MEDDSSSALASTLGVLEDLLVVGFVSRGSDEVEPPSDFDPSLLA